MESVSFKADSNVLALLELASDVSEDEMGNIQYIFDTTVAKVILDHCYLDGDTSVRLFVAGQEPPIVQVDLVNCDRLKVVNDKRGQYLEIVGQYKVED